MRGRRCEATADARIRRSDARAAPACGVRARLKRRQWGKTRIPRRDERLAFTARQELSAGESPSWLRHRILIPAFEGSNPSSPAILKIAERVLSLFFEAREIAPHDSHACQALFRRGGESVQVPHLTAAASNDPNEAYRVAWNALEFNLPSLRVPGFDRAETLPA